MLYGDVPLIKQSTLLELIEAAEHDHAVSILSFISETPTGYGRIIRDLSDNVTAIIEEKDASARIRAINECNSGILLIKGSEYKALLLQLDANNHQQEYYLTDVVKHAVAKNQTVVAVICENESEVLGVNNQQQLAHIEQLYREQKAAQLMIQGVKLSDPQRIDVRGNLSVGSDVTIDVNCIFIGEVELGNDCLLYTSPSPRD